MKDMDVEIELHSHPEIIERKVIGIPNAAVREKIITNVT